MGFEIIVPERELVRKYEGILEDVYWEEPGEVETLGVAKDAKVRVVDVRDDFVTMYDAYFDRIKILAEEKEGKMSATVKYDSPLIDALNHFKTQGIEEVASELARFEGKGLIAFIRSDEMTNPQQRLDMIRDAFIPEYVQNYLKSLRK